MAIGYVEKAAYTKEELAAYDNWLIDLMTARGMLDDALEEGKAIGLEKGLEKGRTETQIQSVLNGHRAGYKIDVISTFTGLTIEQIKDILKQHGLE
jgi:predicted transposase YdaD